MPLCRRRQRLPTLAAVAAALAAALLAAVLLLGGGAPPARASQPGARQAYAGTADPYSPAYRHPYRRGVVPSVGRLARMRSWASGRASGASAFSTELRYGGGIDGIGVTTGAEKVYLVYWGSQWGTRGTNSQGDMTLSGDPSGAAPYLQRLLRGLGTGGETWSGVATQYCQDVPAGATSCPAGSTQRVAYPTGGALAGVWADESSPAPGLASGHQIGAEAVRAAGHFGNTTAQANRNAQYLILSPTGTHPDGFNTPSGNFCAWHDWNGDGTLPGGPVASPYGDIAFTNLPYVTDLGRSCGENFVNAGTAGLLDGFSIVAGHEYAETITDQNPAGGWTDPWGNEIGDLCAWNSGPGARSADLVLPTGTFAMQPLWANGTPGTCEFSHAPVGGGAGGGSGGGGNTVTVTNPGNQRTLRYSPVMLTIAATDSAQGQTLTYSSAGLPPGLVLSPSTGTISGRPSTIGTYGVRVTATDGTGAAGSASFTWTVTAGGWFFARLAGAGALAQVRRGR